jgi:predicted hydrolase (HD superfamily)
VKPIDFYTLSRTQENDVIQHFPTFPTKIEGYGVLHTHACDENMQKKALNAINVMKNAMRTENTNALQS